MLRDCECLNSVRVDSRIILITGGAGYLGTCIANFLISSGYRVRIMDVCALVESDYMAPVEYVKGDVRDPVAMAEALEGVSWIIHTAAALPFKNQKDVVSVTVDGTTNLLDVAKKKDINRLLFISSTAVYGLQDNVPVQEAAPKQGKTDHARAKILAEKLCEDTRKEGMVIAILRPAPLIGEGRMGIFKIFYDWIREGRRLPMIGRGNNRLQLLEVQDLCRAVEVILNSPLDLVNDDFNVGAEAFGTLKEDLTAFIAAVNSESKIIHFSSYPILLLLRFGEMIKISPVYEGVYGIMNKDVYHSVEKMRTKLGWRPQNSNVDALVKAYRWYLGHEAVVAGDNMNNKKGLREGILSIIKKMF